MLSNIRQSSGGKSAISLAVVFVEYDSVQYGDSFPQLREYLARIEHCPITYVRVDNKHEDVKPTLIEKDVYKVGGNNEYREFSGWQKGIETINSLNIPCNVVLFANEAFLKPGESFLKDYADISLLKKALDNNTIIGRIDTLGRRFFVYGYSVSQWICTNCLFVPKAALDKMQDIVSVKDNIGDFVNNNCNRNHVLVDREFILSDTNDGMFELGADLAHSGLCDLRIEFDKSFTPKQVGLSEDTRRLSFCLTEFAVAGQGIHTAELVRGFYNYPQDKWIAKNAVVTLPVDNPGRVVLKGYVPPDVFQNIYNGKFRIKVYNDSCLFKENAPISRNYQQWIIEWFTERWHSKFEISSETWPTFKTKLAAILNEALLSAKFVELGCTLQSYGSKKYY